MSGVVRLRSGIFLLSGVSLGFGIWADARFGVVGSPGDMAGVRVGLLTGLLTPALFVPGGPGLVPGVLAPSIILLNEIALEVLIPGRSIPRGISSSSSSMSRWVLADSLGLRIFLRKAAADTLAVVAM